MKRTKEKRKGRSIFRAVFVPLILVMIVESVVLYITAIYGNVGESVKENEARVFSERLTSRKNELEDEITKRWINLDDTESFLTSIYQNYAEKYGTKPFVRNEKVQILYLEKITDTLINTLRGNKVNGVFVILNAEQTEDTFEARTTEKKNGICIRDLDSNSVYDSRKDLLVERAPLSVLEKTGCSLDSWWEPQYIFKSRQEGDYYYEPMWASKNNMDAKGTDIGYYSSNHKISKSDQEVVSYSIPLTDDDGFTYGVLGIEITTEYLKTLLPNEELGDTDKTGYVLSTCQKGSKNLMPITGTGALYNRSFKSGDTIQCNEESKGYLVDGHGKKSLYEASSVLNIYNNNNPFEKNQIVLTALIDRNEISSNLVALKKNFFFVSVLSLVISFLGIFAVSRHFARPIIDLAQKVRKMEPTPKISLEHIGINEIDQLIDSLEILNQNASKEMARMDFFSRMSHDMRTPMNAIISFSSKEMREGCSDEEKEEYLDKIHSSGEYLLGLINEVLDMTKIESNKVDLNYQPVAIDKLWITVLPIVEKLAQKHEIRFESQIFVPQGKWVKVDQQHLNQIVLNLLSNAVKFTPKGGTVTLTVDAKESFVSKDMLLFEIQVKDTGIGMSKKFLKKLYRPFEQESVGQGGTGLGLSITKKLVTLMHGSIECESVKRVGTTFIVKLPLHLCEPDEKEKTLVIDAKKEEIAEQVLEGKRVLLCEDQEINAQIVTHLLERRGMQVVVCENGLRGVETFHREKNHFDVILMDIRMPVMNGLDAAREIRSIESEYAQKIPIIALTANAFTQDMEKSRKAGINAHLSKPIEPDMLFQTLKQLLS